MKTRGFTLIELLVVIAIIGILSSVVLASLNQARSKGKDAAVKAGLSQLRAQAELYADGNSGDYDGVCDDDSVTRILANVDDNATIASVCNDVAGSSWVATAGLSNDDLYCVDATGFAGVAASLDEDESICVE